MKDIRCAVSRAALIATVAGLAACDASPTAPSRATPAAAEVGPSALTAEGASAMVLLVVPGQNVLIERGPGDTVAGWIQARLQFREGSAREMVGEIHLVLGGSESGGPPQASPDAEWLHAAVSAGSLGPDLRGTFEGTATQFGRGGEPVRFPFTGSTRRAAAEPDLIFDIVGNTLHDGATAATDRFKVVARFSLSR